MGVWSLVIGLAAVVGFAVNPPFRGCLGNPLYFLMFAVAGLGVVLGMGALITADRQGRRVFAVAGMAACVASPFVGARLAPRIPGRNDSATLGDIRTVFSAQAAYQSGSGGSYGALACLPAPADCIPAYPTNAPTFLDSQLASLQPKSGYARSFVTRAVEGSPSQIEAYAYVAVPISPETGVRGYCGDSSGEICYTPDGDTPPVRDARCVVTEDKPSAWFRRGPPGCHPLR